MQIHTKLVWNELSLHFKPNLIYELFGNFADIKVVAKYAARVGLLLSPTALTIFVPDGTWGIEEDIRGLLKKISLERLWTVRYFPK